MIQVRSSKRVDDDGEECVAKFDGERVRKRGNNINGMESGRSKAKRR